MPTLPPGARDKVGQPPLLRHRHQEIAGSIPVLVNDEESIFKFFHLS